MNNDFAEMLKSLVPAYLANRKDELMAIETAVNDRDFKKLRTIGHQMKGHGPSYGFPRLGEIGMNIEEASMQEDLESLKGAVVSLRSFLSDHAI